MAPAGSTIVHQADEFAAELAAQQAASARRMRVLLGAGASRTCGLPDLAGLAQAVLDRTSGRDRADLDALLAGKNLEQALNRLRRLIAILQPGESLGGIDADRAVTLERLVTSCIVDTIATTGTQLDSYRSFAAWVAAQRRHYPVELFTLNYDLLLESALDERSIAYFDGFVGTIRGGFREDLVEPLADQPELPSFVVRLWKLHGSINWRVDTSSTPRKVLRLGQPATGEVAAIYPSEEKYEASRRSPFLVLHDRFRRSINEPKSLLLLSGYSFGDEHLNDVIFEAARRNPRTSIIAFCYGDLADRAISPALELPNLTIAGRIEAIWGGVRGKWEGLDVAGVWESGSFLLGDFGPLAQFLSLADTTGTVA